MNYKLIKNTAFLTLLVMTVFVSAFAVKMGLAEEDVSDHIEILWTLFFAFLVSVWALNDKRNRKEGVPFSYGLILFFLWPIVLAYHLATTRGVDGVHSYFGFLALYVAPVFSWLYAYSYYS
ncbi:MAG: hypothetical protein JKY88_06570 [Pseudomonadales bacterium]|nr:hypothetical protein [Pseudomonadales bacterium]